MENFAVFLLPEKMYATNALSRNCCNIQELISLSQELSFKQRLDTWGEGEMLHSLFRPWGVVVMGASNNPFPKLRTADYLILKNSGRIRLL
jgi:hypothetical protein